jgi:hypothetical protein
LVWWPRTASFQTLQEEDPGRSCLHELLFQDSDAFFCDHAERVIYGGAGLPEKFLPLLFIALLDMVAGVTVLVYVFLQQCIPGFFVIIQVCLHQPGLELCRKGRIRDGLLRKDGMRMPAATASYAPDPDPAGAIPACFDPAAVPAPEDEVPCPSFLSAERTDEQAAAEESMEEFQELSVSFPESIGIESFFKSLENIYRSRYHGITWVRSVL